MPDNVQSDMPSAAADPGVLDALQLPVVHFDDLVVGFSCETPGRTVTEGDIVTFAGLSGDYNLLHTDAEYSATTNFGQRVAHGLLVLSITSGLTARLTLIKAMETTILGLLQIECVWIKPTLIGDTIHVVVTVEELKTVSKPDRGIVVLDRTVRNQRGEDVMKSTWKLLVRRRQQDPT